MALPPAIAVAQPAHGDQTQGSSHAPRTQLVVQTSVAGGVGYTRASDSYHPFGAGSSPSDSEQASSRAGAAELWIGARLNPSKRSANIVVGGQLRVGKTSAPTSSSERRSTATTWMVGPKVELSNRLGLGVYAYGTVGWASVRSLTGLGARTGVGYRMRTHGGSGLGIEAVGSWYRTSEDGDGGTYVYGDLTIGLNAIWSYRYE